MDKGQGAIKTPAVCRGGRPFLMRTGLAIKSGEDARADCMVMQAVVVMERDAIH